MGQKSLEDQTCVSLRSAVKTFILCVKCFYHDTKFGALR